MSKRRVLTSGVVLGDRYELQDQVSERLGSVTWRALDLLLNRNVGVELIPKKVARNFVDAVERKLAGTNFKHKSRLPVELMDAYARQRARQGFSHVVFGHFHNKVVMPASSCP